ncbi:hypothetical protein PVAND_010749 [Polypedilum vanderplanki]|uniref:DNA-directed RNA polymerase III subunit RPC5 n=1 Tax=Polypedilum vanderplanki TaxID=319348 RepID=A0A9J6CHS5_POLVA|nr:hypothetical protein PVAND_010749 [Polypedilum vanderplanki]
MIDNDDPIIDEIPVYLSSNLAKNLYILQFPVNNTFDIDQSKISNCCLKPESKQIKIDFTLDTASRNYDAFKGEMLAKTADGSKSTNDKNDLPSFSSGRMDKSTFISSLPFDNQKFAVGVMQDKQLHLVPVKNFFQMRQTFSHFDKGDKRIKSEKSGDDDDDDDLKQVTVKFAKPAGDSERIKKARERSYQFISSIGKDEAWCETLIYSKISPESELERQKILYTGGQQQHLSTIPVQDYFETLMTPDKGSISLTSHEPSKSDDTSEKHIDVLKGIVSKRLIKRLPLIDQLKVVLKDSKVLTFNNIMDLIGSQIITTEKVLRTLALCGIMIRGNWTLQSEHLYPGNYISVTNGISSELMCRGRDYILFKLMRNELMTLNRQKLSVITQLPAEETKEILESVASLKSNKTWDLLKPPDYEFEKRHPEIIQRQEAFWRAQEEKFAEMEAEKPEKRKRTKSVRETK